MKLARAALALLVAASSASSAAAAACKSLHDCSYTGVCKAGTCHCEPQFQGDRCDVFAFAPLDLEHQGTGLRSINETTGGQISSWGGSVIAGDDGKYDMWAAEMTHEVGIKAWITNSQVVHAIASGPTSTSSKPYDFVRKDVVAPIFAHEPTVARAPTGE